MKILSIDAETNGLYGKSFAIAFTIREGGKELYSWSGRCPDKVVTDQWVRENVLPSLKDMPITHDFPEALEESFWMQWMAHKEGCEVIAHMPHPVETGLFRRCVERDTDSRWRDGPYPGIHDVASTLLLDGYPSDSVDGYLKTKGVKVQFDGTAHNPMFDAIAAAQAWEILTAREYVKKVTVEWRGVKEGRVEAPFPWKGVGYMLLACAVVFAVAATVLS